VDEQGGVTEHSELVLWFAPDCGKSLMWLSAKRVQNPAKYVDVWVISVNVTWLRAGRPGILICPAGNRFLSFPKYTFRLWGPQILLRNWNRRLFPWGKAVGVWSWQSSSNAEFRKEWRYTSTLPTCFHGMDNNMTFIFYNTSMSFTWRFSEDMKQWLVMLTFLVLGSEAHWYTSTNHMTSAPTLAFWLVVVAITDFYKFYSLTNDNRWNKDRPHQWSSVWCTSVMSSVWCTSVMSRVQLQP
jgi:hypothetical protein